MLHRESSRLCWINLALCTFIIEVSVACSGSAPSATKSFTVSSPPALQSPRVRSPTLAQTSDMDVSNASDPNWLLFQTALDRALARAGDQLAEVEWGDTSRILLSLSYSEEIGEFHLAAVEYLREGLRKRLKEISTVSVVDEIEDNLPNTDVEALYRLGRTFDVDSFLLVDIWALGIRPLEERLPSTPAFQAEASVAINLVLFRLEEGYYDWIGDPIFETYQGKYIVRAAIMPTVTLPQNAKLSLIAGEPYTLISLPGVTYRDVVWSPDSQSVLFSSGSVEEVEGRLQFVGNIFLSDLDGETHQLTYLSAFENPWIYSFLPDGERIILVTNNDIIRVIDRQGELLHATTVSPPLDFCRLMLIPGKPELVAIETGTRSGEDPDGLWVFNLKSETVHTFAELYNGGQPLVDVVKEEFFLGSEFVTLSDFEWSGDGHTLAFTAKQSRNGTWHRTFLRFDLESRALTLLGDVGGATLASRVDFSPKCDRAAVGINQDNARLLRIFDGSESPLQVNDTGYACASVWSPDGAWIAYAYAQGPGDLFNIWIASADGSQSRPMAETEAKSIGQLVWSPDSRHLVVSAQVGEDVGIWIVPIIREAQ